MVSPDNVGADLAKRSPFSTEDYASITSFADALELVNERLGGEVIDSQDLGDGFALCEDKDSLLKIPFIILATTFSEGEYKDEAGNLTTFVSCRIVTQDGRKLVLNDGGTGIHDQILLMHQHHPETVGKPIICRNGLRKSTYDHPQHGKATTYYLDTSGKK